MSLVRGVTFKIQTYKQVRVRIIQDGEWVWKTAVIRKIDFIPEVGETRQRVGEIDLDHGSGLYLIWVSIPGLCSARCFKLCPALGGDMGNPDIDFPGKELFPARVACGRCEDYMPCNPKPRTSLLYIDCP